MKRHQLKVEANNVPATLERVLRAIRYRGFFIDKVYMDAVATERTFEIHICVTGERAIEQIENQLMKLVDINKVYVESSQIMPEPV